MGELIASLENYSIYKSYINETDSYYLCIPNGNIGKCQIVLGFSDKNFDTLSDDDIINKISEVNDMIYSLNNDSIYAIANIDEVMFRNAVLENDNRLYENLLNNCIHPITQNIYNMLVKNGVKKGNVNQVISVIKRTDGDKKFAGWLSMRLGDNFINEINYSELISKYRIKEESSMVDVVVVENYNIDSLPNGDISDDIDMSVMESDSNKMVNNDHKISPINHSYDNVEIKENEKHLVKKLTKPVDKSLGFSSFKFIIVFMTVFMIIGITIGYLLIK